jgi:hypothetical protein
MGISVPGVGQNEEFVFTLTRSPDPSPVYSVAVCLFQKTGRTEDQLGSRLLGRPPSPPEWQPSAERITEIHFGTPPQKIEVGTAIESEIFNKFSRFLQTVSRGAKLGASVVLS